MSYKDNGATACIGPSLEERIAREMKEQEIDKALLLAIEAFSKFYGEYTLQEMELEKSYGMIAIKYRMRKKKIKDMLIEQKRKGRKKK